MLEFGKSMDRELHEHREACYYMELHYHIICGSTVFHSACRLL